LANKLVIVGDAPAIHYYRVERDGIAQNDILIRILKNSRAHVKIG
jgi:hypothetical protein